MTSAEILWLVLGAAVVAYAVTGGADYGAGVLHLFARGRHATESRRLIEAAIAPIWEANHVWLIFAVVVLFSAFPRAFSAVSVSLHIPITLALLGMVFRGTSFVFHAYGLREATPSRLWTTLFGASSVATPLLLGDVLGALATGEIRWDGRGVTSGYLAGWLTPFAFGTGVFALFLFTMLASVYLCAEAEGSVRARFRRIALTLEATTFLVAMFLLWLARTGAPALYAGLIGSSWAWVLQGLTAGTALATGIGLVSGAFALARVTAAAQVAFVAVGFGASLRGALVLPDLNLTNAGTRPEIALVLIPVLAGGAVLLIPSLIYLFRVFKARG